MTASRRSAASKTRPIYEKKILEVDEEDKPGKIFTSPVRDRIAAEMDSLFDILGGGVQVETTAQRDDVDIERIRWYQFQPRLSDKIGDTYLSISTPPPRCPF